MHTAHWRRGIVTALTTAFLATGASAQDGARQEVKITDKTPTSVLQTTTTTSKAVKPVLVDRDPFINQLEQTRVSDRSPTTIRPKPVQEPRVGDTQKERTSQLSEPGEEIALATPAPEVTVNGIVTAGTERQAIISTSVGTRMITVGERLGDYRVSAIGSNDVTFSYGSEKSFKIPMQSEFSAE